MKVRFWGTRGSVPVSGPAFTRHGGSTTCLDVMCPSPTGEVEERLIIDCGSGITKLGEAYADVDDVEIWQTHVHWDHIQGLPFFDSIYDPSSHLHVRGVDRDGCSLREILSRQMSRPTFPVEFEDVGADVSFERLPEEGTRARGGLTIRWAEMCHPSGCSAYRFEHRGSVFVFSGDVEIQQGCRQKLIEFARGADILLMDAQYFAEEYETREGFGHSTPQGAAEIADAVGVDHLFMTHHHPGHDDEQLDAKAEVARNHASGDYHVANARDGLALELGGDSMTMRSLEDEELYGDGA